jgi:hypothetical protein
MPIIHGSDPDLKFTYYTSSVTDVYSLPPPKQYELYSEHFDLLEYGKSNKAGSLYFVGSSFENNGYPNSFNATLDLGELGTIVFLWSIPPNAPLDPVTGFYLPGQTFYFRILQGSGNFKFVQNGFVVVHTFVGGGRHIYVYIDK